MISKLKNNNGFVAADAAIGIILLIILSSLIITILFNIYNMNLTLHRTAMATNYAVEIIENAKLLNYYDEQLKDGVYEGNTLFGITLAEQYNAKLEITDYNKLPENNNKEDLIKKLYLTIEYKEGNLLKNISFSTLKINNNI